MFSKGDIATFLRCSVSTVDDILDRLRIPHWYKRKFTEQEARRILAQFYSDKGRRGIVNGGSGPKGRGRL